MSKHLIRNISLGVSGIILLASFAVNKMLHKPELNLQGSSLNPTQAVEAFELSSTQGGTFSRKDLLGKWTVLSFGFTHCPDICPTTLAYFRDELKTLSSDQKEQAQFVFVTVDPERDTLPLLTEYTQKFHPDIIGLTGSQEEIEKFASIFHAYFKKENPQADGLYSMAHSPQYFLVNPQGQWQVLYTPPLSKGAIALDLTKLKKNF